MYWNNLKTLETLMELSLIFLIFSMGKKRIFVCGWFSGAAINYAAGRKRIFPVAAEPSFSILRYELIKGTREDILESKVKVKRVTWKISGETSFSKFIYISVPRSVRSIRITNIRLKLSYQNIFFTRLDPSKIPKRQLFFNTHA